jgi:hypothetical protein
VFAGAVRCHASNRGDIDGLGAWAGRQSIPNTEDHFTSRYRSAFGAVAPALVRPTGTATLDRATSEWRPTPRAFYIDILGFEVRTDVTMGEGSAS